MFITFIIVLQECHLRHLRHIPNILQMLRILITKYGKQITREETETMTLQDCVNQFRNGNNIMYYKQYILYNV